MEQGSVKLASYSKGPSIARDQLRLLSKFRLLYSGDSAVKIMITLLTSLALFSVKGVLSNPFFLPFSTTFDVQVGHICG